MTLLLGLATQLFVVATDGKQVLRDGEQVVPAVPVPDRLIVLSLDRGRLRRKGDVPVPASVIGPPHSVALTADGRLALVTSARRLTADGRAIEPDDRVTLVALTPTPHVIATARAGAGASGVAIDSAGTRALVANRSAGTVTLLAITAVTLTPLATVAVGAPTSSPARPVFVGERRALVTRDGDHRVVELAIEGDNVRIVARALAPGLRPYDIDAAQGLAVTGNIGGGGKDVDTVSLIATGADARVLDTVAAGLTPEGVAISPDGRFVAATDNNASNAPRASPRWSDHGLLRVWRVVGDRLIPVATAPMGGWGQGVAWTRDGRAIVAEAMIDRSVTAWRFDGRRLTQTDRVTLDAGPAGLAMAP